MAQQSNSKTKNMARRLLLPLLSMITGHCHRRALYCLPIPIGLMVLFVRAPQCRICFEYSNQFEAVMTSSKDGNLLFRINLLIVLLFGGWYCCRFHRCCRPRRLPILSYACLCHKYIHIHVYYYFNGIQFVLPLHKPSWLSFSPSLSLPFLLLCRLISSFVKK